MLQGQKNFLWRRVGGRARDGWMERSTNEETGDVMSPVISLWCARVPLQLSKYSHGQKRQTKLQFYYLHSEHLNRGGSAARFDQYTVKQLKFRTVQFFSVWIHVAFRFRILFYFYFISVSDRNKIPNVTSSIFSLQMRYIRTPMKGICPWLYGRTFATKSHCDSSS
jgi:hypothetical protein